MQRSERTIMTHMIIEANKNTLNHKVMTICLILARYNDVYSYASFAFEQTETKHEVMTHLFQLMLCI